MVADQHHILRPDLSIRVLLATADEGWAADISARLMRLQPAMLFDRATSAAAATLELDHAPSQLCLLDLGLPTGDGMTLLESLTARENGPAVIAVAPAADARLAASAIVAGADDYLIKGQFDDFALETSIAFSLHRNEKMRAIKAAMVRDPLTGLANRALFKDRLYHAAERAKRQNSTFAVLYIDIDRFKQVNDTHGHATGDALLIEIARRLIHGIRTSDTVARLGGDEFAVLLENPDRGAVGRIGRALQRAIEAITEIDGRSVSVGASIGAALYAVDATLPDDLVATADGRMYQAKKAGGGLAMS